MHTLYAVERQADPLKLRHEILTSAATELRKKLLRWKEQLLPRHPMAEAANYKRWASGRH